MARLMEVADAAAERIRAWLPGLKQCRVHAGVFSRSELERLSTATPAIYLSVIGTHGNTAVGDGRRNVEAEFAASILTRDVGERSAEEVAEEIGAALLARVPAEQWGQTGLGGATEVRLRNEFSTVLAELGVALWILTWRQPIRLAPAASEDVDCPLLPTEVYLSQEPETGRAHAADYERVTG